MEDKNYRNLFAELSEYENCGISMKLENLPASPMQIVKAIMIREDNAYMRDYEWDDKGHITKLSFHQITQQ